MTPRRAVPDTNHGRSPPRPTDCSRQAGSSTPMTLRAASSCCRRTVRTASMQRRSSRMTSHVPPARTATRSFAPWARAMPDIATTLRARPAPCASQPPAIATLPTCATACTTTRARTDSRPQGPLAARRQAHATQRRRAPARPRRVRMMQRNRRHPVPRRGGTLRPSRELQRRFERLPRRFVQAELDRVPRSGRRLRRGGVVRRREQCVSGGCEEHGGVPCVAGRVRPARVVRRRAQ